MYDFLGISFSNSGINKHYITENQLLANILNVDPSLILGSTLFSYDVTGGNLNSPYIVTGGGIVNAQYSFLSQVESYFFTAEQWNSVKDISAVSIGTERISFTVDNFVHADIDFSMISADVSLYALDSKRGNLATGSGNDFVKITSATNDLSWSNLHMINTGSGDDTVIIGQGDASIINTSIVKYIDGHFTKTEVFLGAGNDTFYTIDGVHTKDLVRAGDGDDTIHSGFGNDYISGDGGNDTIFSGDGNDTLKGQNGNDIISGEGGDDVLWGNDGNDILYGGTGNDWMKGGNGNDLFVLDGATNGEFDTIDDLKISKGDYLQIKDILSFDHLTDVISDFVKISDNSIDSYVSVDIDGATGGHNFVQIVHILGVTGLDAMQLYADGDLVISNVVP